MAKRPLESERCPKRSKKAQSIVLSILNLRKFMDGQKIIADTWTSRRPTSPTTQLDTNGTGTKTPSYWYLIMISKLDGCKREKI